MFFKKQNQKITHNIARLECERRCKKKKKNPSNRLITSFAEENFCSFWLQILDVWLPHNLGKDLSGVSRMRVIIFPFDSWKNAGNSVLQLWCCYSEKCRRTGLESVSLGSTPCAVADSALLFHGIADWVRIAQNRVFQLSHRRHKML